MIFLFLLGCHAYSLDTYTQLQSRAALSGILANSNEYPGVIAASLALDTARPGESGGQNYYYQWTRDAALTIKTIINQFASGDTKLEPFIRAYVENESKLQHLDTLSGNFTTGGLAEPKYYMNSTPFNDPWGRPQRDGPALRSIAIMGYLSLLNDTAYINNVTRNVVKPDLDYVAQNWRESGFDLWEEQNGTHFFTAMVQARALEEGAAFFSQRNGTAALQYAVQEAQLGTVIDSFWNMTGNTFDAQLNSTKPTGADCANMLAAIHGSKRYSPSSDKILASLSTLIDEMTPLYPITLSLNSTAIPVGRYPSDVYDGIQSSKGNPWFLCNSAVAEVLYTAAREYDNKTIEVNDINAGFMQKVGNETKTFSANVRKYADAFLEIEQHYVGANFSMSEQINRTTGAQQGARDLTWSYAAFISAVRARANQSTYNFATGYPSNALLTPLNNITNYTTSSTNTNSTTTFPKEKSSASALAVPFFAFLVVAALV